MCWNSLNSWIIQAQTFSLVAILIFNGLILCLSCCFFFSITSFVPSTPDCKRWQEFFLMSFYIYIIFFYLSSLPVDGKWINITFMVFFLWGFWQVQIVFLNFLFSDISLHYLLVFYKHGNVLGFFCVLCCLNADASYFVLLLKIILMVFFHKC